MNDLFRAIFGIPSYDQHVNRMDNRRPNDEDDSRDECRSRGDDDDDDDVDCSCDGKRFYNRRRIFGFPIFTDPVEIHKHFDRLVYEMNKAFGLFGFNNQPSITWPEEDRNNPSCIHETSQQQEQCSLRDAYLKQPDCGCDTAKPRDDYDVVINNYEAGTSRDQNMEVQVPYPKVYSKSVYIQTVRRPDGTVETIKKVRDHKGNEETTITHSNVNDPALQDDQHLPPKEDSSGMSLFKKFFPF